MRLYRQCRCERVALPQTVYGIPLDLLGTTDVHAYDFTCVRCGTTVPMCEGGGTWDEAVSTLHKGESHIGVCTACSELLTERHGDLDHRLALRVLFPARRLKAKRLGNMTLRYR